MVVRLYAQWMHKRPLLTAMTSSGLLGAASDIICQFGIEKCSWNSYNGLRTTRFFVSAFLWEAPILSRWMLFLNTIKGSSKFLNLKRLAVDQLTFAPIFSATIIFNMRILEGNTISSSIAQLKEDYVTIMTTFYKIWPPVLMFTYSYVPLNYRVVFIQVVALLWNVYFSFALNINQNAESLQYKNLVA